MSGNVSAISEPNKNESKDAQGWHSQLHVASCSVYDGMFLLRKKACSLSMPKRILKPTFSLPLYGPSVLYHLHSLGLHHQHCCKTRSKSKYQLVSYSTVPLETIATLDMVFSQWLDVILLHIGYGTTSKGTWLLRCGKDTSSFAVVNSGRIRILNRPFVSTVLQLDSIILEDN